MRIADIGTGSGAIALLWRCYPNCQTRPASAPTSTRTALCTARDNAARLALAKRAGFVACDYASGLCGPFDLIVSNPPYIRSADIARADQEVRDHDPPAALDGGPDAALIASRAIIPPGGRIRLAPGGATLIVEARTGPERRWLLGG